MIVWDKRARLVDVHDGDTITVDLDQGFGDTKRIKVRLLGVFAPELRQVGGPECKTYLRALLANVVARGDWPLLVVTSRTADHETTTFERYVCTVSNYDGTQSVNASMQAYITEQGYLGGIGARP